MCSLLQLWQAQGTQVVEPKELYFILTFFVKITHCLGGILPPSVFRVKYSGNQMRILLHYKRGRGQNLVSVDWEGFYSCTKYW